jgi:hypothetical protein
MAVTFQEQIKKQRNLILVFLGLILVAGFVIWRGYFYKEKPVEEMTLKHFKKIEVDFDVLEAPLLSELEPMEKIPAFDGEVGKENPFVP